MATAALPAGGRPQAARQAGLEVAQKLLTATSTALNGPMADMRLSEDRATTVRVIA